MRRGAVLLPIASAKTSNKPMVLDHQPKALGPGVPDSLAPADPTFDENGVPSQEMHRSRPWAAIFWKPASRDYFSSAPSTSVQ
jgi:hypothetical protein